MKHLFLFSAFGLCASLCAHGEVESKASPSKKTALKIAVKKNGSSSVEVVARVGKHAITSKDLQDRIDLILVTSHSPLNEDNRKALREQVLKNLIEELVQLTVAQKYKVEAKDKEITESIEHMAKENGATVKSLEASLAAQGIPLASLKDRIRAQLSWNNFIRGAYAHTLHVTEEDIQTYHTDLKANENKAQYEVFEIFLRSDPETQTSVKKQADDIVAKVRNGANFRMLAQQFSHSPSASRGGYLGWVSDTHEGNQAYTKLEPSQISSPVQTNHGYYIYYLAEKKLPGQVLQSSQLISYTQITVPLTKGFTPETDPYLQTHMQGLMEAKNGQEFEKIARERELHIEKIKDRPLRQVPVEYHGFFKDLKIGTPSQPAMTPDGLMIVIVNNRRTPEPPKPASKEETKEILENAKLSKISIRDLTKHLQGVFIEITHPAEFPGIPYGVRKSDTKS